MKPTKVWLRVHTISRTYDFDPDNFSEHESYVNAVRKAPEGPVHGYWGGVYTSIPTHQILAIHVMKE